MSAISFKFMSETKNHNPVQGRIGGGGGGWEGAEGD